MVLKKRKENDKRLRTVYVQRDAAIISRNILTAVKEIEIVSF